MEVQERKERTGKKRKEMKRSEAKTVQYLSICIDNTKKKRMNLELFYVCGIEIKIEKEILHYIRTDYRPNTMLYACITIWSPLATFEKKKKSIIL